MNLLITRCLALVLVLSTTGCAIGPPQTLGGKCSEILEALEQPNQVANSLVGDKVVNYMLYELEEQPTLAAIDVSLEKLEKYGPEDLGEEYNFNLLEDTMLSLGSMRKYLNGSDLFKLLDVAAEFRENSAQLRSVCDIS
jgi:hypothetical protein